MTDRILTKKNLISFGLFTLLFHAALSFIPYFAKADWLFVIDYILLGIMSFATIVLVAKQQAPIRFQPAQVLLLFFFGLYIVSCLSMSIKYNNDWVTYNGKGLLDTAVSILLAFPLGYIIIREEKTILGKTLLHIILLSWTIFISYVLFRIFRGESIPTLSNGLIRIKSGALQLNCNQNTTGAWEMLFFLVCCLMTLWCKMIPLKIIYGLASVIHYVGLTLSNCRAGFLASLLGFMAITGIAVYLWFDKKKKPNKLLFAVVAAMIAGITYYFLSQLVFTLYNFLTGAESSSRAFVKQEKTFTGREEVWLYAINGIFSSPRCAVFGVTPASTTELIKQMSNGLRETYSHNQFLEIAAAIGIPGLCVFLVWFYMIMRDAYKLYFVEKERTLFLAVPVLIITMMLANMMEAYLVFLDYINAYAFFLLCGLLYGKVNEPIQVKILSRQEIRNKERKKKKK